MKAWLKTWLENGLDKNVTSKVFEEWVYWYHYRDTINNYPCSFLAFGYGYEVVGIAGV